MCGICGIHYIGRRRVDLEEIAPMLSAIRHRGPDDEGVFIDEGISLGVRRLSIIDLPGGRQPIRNEDGSIVVAFNGEIYNYRELRRRLALQGHELATSSDTEVIVHLYEDLGDECVHELRGMFSFAVWDGRRRRLLIARDRLGIKPIYWASVAGGVVFGSEIKALLQHPGLQARLNLAALPLFLGLKYVPAPQTLFAGINALPPGHLLVCDERGSRTTRYWDLSFARQDDAKPERQWEAELGEILAEVVELHLVSDVPFGAFLSGGLDSSLIVALMSRLLGKRVKTFSVGFDEDGGERSELPYARLVAKRFATDHHEVVVRPDDLIEHLERVVWHLDQPIGDEASLATYILSDLASREVKMVLTGEGGDELFAGYARYAGEQLSPTFRRVPASVRELMLTGSDRLPGLRRPKLALNALCEPDEAARLASWFALFNTDMRTALLTREVREAVDGSSPTWAYAHQLARTDAVDPLSRMLYVDTKLWLPDDLLARNDKMSMAASLEARVPLLDHRLVEFAARIPPELKLRRWTRKYLLRQFARRLLPEAIVTRKKQGFPLPTSSWFRDQARPLVRDLLSPDVIRRRALFDPIFVSKLVLGHERGRADHGSLIFALLTLELWFRRYVD